MAFAIVNAPFTCIPAATLDLHFLGNGGIQLHLSMAGNYPRIPGITLGLGLVHYPLLFAPAGWPSWYSRAGRRLRHSCPWRSDEQHVPVPMAPRAAKTGSAGKTGGIIDRRGRPYEKVPPPASFRSLVSTALRGHN